MATLAPINLGETWANMGPAPITFTVLSGDIEVAASNTAPAAGIKGHPYGPGTGDMFTIGPNVWGRCIGGAAQVVVTVA